MTVPDDIVYIEFTAEGKSSFYDMLRKKNLVAEKATVNGKSVNNVIKGYCMPFG